MESTVKQRLIKFIKYKELSQGKFEKTIGAGNGFVNNISKSIGAEKLQSILSNFPELDAKWLLYGEGEMLTHTGKKFTDNTVVSGNVEGNIINNKTKSGNNTVGVGDGEDLMNISQLLKDKDSRITQLEDQIRVKDEQIAKLLEKI